MSWAHFQRLSGLQQVRWVLACGTYLADRQDGQQEINLYYLPGTGRGFFAEVVYDARLDRLVVPRSFYQVGPLAAYARPLALPADWFRPD